MNSFLLHLARYGGLYFFALIVLSVYVPIALFVLAFAIITWAAWGPFLSCPSALKEDPEAIKLHLELQRERLRRYRIQNDAAETATSVPENCPPPPPPTVRS